MMKIDAIVYSSMTGFTAECAQILSGSTGLPAYTLEDAAEKLNQKSRVLIKKISAMENKSENEEKLINVLRNGGSFIKAENLEKVLSYLQD